MSSNKVIRQALTAEIAGWFAEAGAPAMEAENIKRFLTSPSETAVSPNWLIVASQGPFSEATTLGEVDAQPRFAIVLLSRISSGEDADESREAAEDWLDDAEEMLVERLAAARNGEHWLALHVRSVKRDPDRGLWGFWRSSQILVEVEKR